MTVSTNQAPPRIASPPYIHSLSSPYVERGAAPLGSLGDRNAATDAVGFASVETAAGVGGGVAGPRRTIPQAGHVSAVDGTAAPQLLQRIS
jgi:hypothetical protein